MTTEIDSDGIQSSGLRILVIGSGGREHAIAWKLAQSSRVDVVYVAPGNAGTATEPKVENVEIKATDIPALLTFVKSNGIDITVVGSEDPLAAGIVDDFRKAGEAIWGPTGAAACIEASKFKAKQLMQACNVPTMPYRSFLQTDSAQFMQMDSARQYVKEHGAPVVIKADGLCMGKGVKVCMTVEEAHSAIDQIRSDFGAAARVILVEDLAVGMEASIQVMVDGLHILPLATSQDNKRLLDGDQGPNTGGTGADSPVPFISSAMEKHIIERVFRPIIDEMMREGVPYTGFLYAGLMITGTGIDDFTVLEFNCRPGDPETQPVLMRLKSDLAFVIQMALLGHLDEVTLVWDERPALDIVLVAQGYCCPGQQVRKGDVITDIPDNTPDMHVFHAGTAFDEHGNVITAGGRVLSVCALGNGLEDAQSNAYFGAMHIQFEGKHMRTDIGNKALEYLRTAEIL